jgi:hypothetical protein
VCFSCVVCSFRKFRKEEFRYTCAGLMHFTSMAFSITAFGGSFSFGTSRMVVPSSSSCSAPLELLSSCCDIVTYNRRTLSRSHFFSCVDKLRTDWSLQHGLWQFLSLRPCRGIPFAFVSSLTQIPNYHKVSNSESQFRVHPSPESARQKAPKKNPMHHLSRALLFACLCLGADGWLASGRNFPLLQRPTNALVRRSDCSLESRGGSPRLLLPLLCAMKGDGDNNNDEFRGRGNNERPDRPFMPFDKGASEFIPVVCTLSASNRFVKQHHEERNLTTCM